MNVKRLYDSRCVLQHTVKFQLCEIDTETEGVLTTSKCVWYNKQGEISRPGNLKTYTDLPPVFCADFIPFWFVKNTGVALRSNFWPEPVKLQFKYRDLSEILKPPEEPKPKTVRRVLCDSALPSTGLNLDLD